MTDSAFTIEELEELHVLFKVRTSFLLAEVQCKKKKCYLCDLDNGMNVSTRPVGLNFRTQQSLKT